MFLSLMVALAAALVVTCFFSPRFVLWRGVAIAEDLPEPFAEFDRAIPSLAQLDDPAQPITHTYHKVLAWRLLFPLVGHYLRVSHDVFLALPHVGCLLALWLSAWLTYERLRRWWPTFYATALLAALPWFFVSCSWLTYFDSWLILGLLAAAFVPSRWALGAACLATPWIEEHFVLALPVTMTVRATALGQIETGNRQDMLRDLATVIATSVPYLMIRLVAWLDGDVYSSWYLAVHMREVRKIPFQRFVDGLWSGYRVAWLIVCALPALAAPHIGWRWAVTLGGIL